MGKTKVMKVDFHGLGQPAPFKYPAEDRATDEGSEDSYGDFMGQHCPGNGVGKQQQKGADHHGGGQQFSIVRSCDKPYHMGNKKPYKSNDTGNRYADSRQHGSGYQKQKGDLFYINPKACGSSVPQGDEI